MPRITADSRPAILASPYAKTYRKTARIVAVRMKAAFEVETEHGIVFAGVRGDYLATNHPDDDPGSDMWPISKDRMAATYVLADETPAAADAPAEPPEGRILPQLGRVFDLLGAAKYLGIHPETLRRAQVAGKVKVRRDRLHQGHPLVFSQADLDAYRDGLLA